MIASWATFINSQPPLQPVPFGGTEYISEFSRRHFIPCYGSSCAGCRLESQEILLGIQLCGIDIRNLLQVVKGLEVPVLLSILNNGFCLSRGEP
jgi:hypothetical protein